MALLQRISALLSNPAADPATVAQYHACVAQARIPAFYAEMAVPDNVDGRFDMLLLHVILVMRRLGSDVDAKQRLFDLMFADMERSLREMGVGDMSIGKKMRPMIQAFYGRAQAYEGALGGDEALAAALAKNLYGAAPVDVAVTRRMVAYVRATIAALDQQPTADLLSGKIEFITP